ncbi:MAG: nucleic acid-binding protein [Methanoregula sp.]|nr:nucleic acid-binding protein [Methanoregula sp.]
MLFHYALVDDLITKEEFEQRVEAKIGECGDLVDEATAAMMVIGELGREHVKIRGLVAKSSLFSFFGKVLDKNEPKEFNRADGEKGWVATLLLGDETGTVRVVLWDEKAGAVLDTVVGDVLEVIGRHPKSGHEIYALALRKAGCEITCTAPAGTGAGSLSAEPVELDAVLLAVEPPRTFTKRDGSCGEMAEAVIGTGEGTARLVAWAPELLAGLPAGTIVHITSAKPNNRGEGQNFSIDEKSTVTVTETPVIVPFTPLHSVADQGIYSVKGEVKQVQQPRSFTTRNGALSWVRNIMIHDADDEMNVVLWGETALFSVSPGDQVEVYHATAKPGRYGGIELGVGRGSVFRMSEEVTRPITFSGTIIAGPGCLFIDNGLERYLIAGKFTHGDEVKVTGLLAGSRIIPEQSEPVVLDTESLLKNVQQFRDQLKT